MKSPGGSLGVMVRGATSPASPWFSDSGILVLGWGLHLAGSQDLVKTIPGLHQRLAASE